MFKDLVSSCSPLSCFLHFFFFFFKVATILVNIFGGIMRCDVIATGVINAAKNIGLKKPIVIRLQGTNVEQANELIANRRAQLLTSSDFKEKHIYDHLYTSVYKPV